MPSKARGKPTQEQRVQWREDREVKLAELHTRIVERVATLTDGEQWRAWLNFSSRFHQYSFNNLIAIWMQHPDATWVAGIRTWNGLDRRVRKGERGIAILAPVIGRRDQTLEPGTPDPTAAPCSPTARPLAVTPTGEPAVELVLARPSVEGSRGIRGFRIVTVFDVSQTEGRELNPPTRPLSADVDVDLLTGDAPDGLWEALFDLAKEHGYRVERGWCDGANGYIRYADHLIRVRDDVDDAQAAKTLIHEIGHMLLHGEADFAGGWSRTCRGQSEVEAESVAFLVAAHVGLDTSAYTFGYVTGWAEQAVKTSKKPPHEIVQATGTRVITSANAITMALDAALSHDEAEGTTDLLHRASAALVATARVRDAAESLLAHASQELPAHPLSAASRAFPATPGSSSSLPSTYDPSPQERGSTYRR